MNELERICEQWNPEEVHRDFRFGALTSWVEHDDDTYIGFRLHAPPKS